MTAGLLEVGVMIVVFREHYDLVPDMPDMQEQMAIDGAIYHARQRGLVPVGAPRVTWIRQVIVGNPDQTLSEHPWHSGPLPGRPTDQDWEPPESRWPVDHVSMLVAGEVTARPDPYQRLANGLLELLFHKHREEGNLL
jgi:hypothetical protein